MIGLPNIGKTMVNGMFLLSCLPFACSWQATRSFFSVAIYPEPLGTFYWTLSMAICLGALGMISVEHGVLSLHPSLRLWLITFLGIAGVVLPTVGCLTPLGEARLLLSCLSVCLTFSYHIRHWGNLYGTSDFTTTVLRVAGALLITGALSLITVNLSFIGQLASNCILLATASLCLSLHKPNPDAPSPRDAYETCVSFSPHRPYSLIVGVTLAQLSVGLSWVAQGGSNSSSAGTTGLLVGALSVIVFALLTAKTHSLNYLVPFSLATIQLSILAALSDMFTPQFTLAILWSACNLLWIWSISICTWQGRLEPEAAGRMAVQGMFLVVVPNLVGEVIGRFLPIGHETTFVIASALLVFAVEIIFCNPRTTSLLSPREPSPAVLNPTSEATAKTDSFIHHYELTAREGDVFVQLQKGYSMRRIADELNLSENTVKSHVKSIYTKTGIHGRQALIDYFERLYRVPEKA